MLLICLASVALANLNYMVKLNPNALSKRDLTKRDTMIPKLPIYKEIISRHDGDSFVGSEPSRITAEYNFNDFVGFAVKTSPQAIEEINQDEDVDYWTFDSPMEILSPIDSNHTNPISNHTIPTSNHTNPASNQTIPWNLDRIDQRFLPLDGKFNPFGNQGEGVTVYVIDTGIDATHPEFEGRAIAGPSFVFGEYREPKSNNTDFHGHGTHCAGIVAAKTFGVAPKARVVGLQVMNETGSTFSGFVAAVQYVVKRAVPGKTVISMSLGSVLANCQRELPSTCINKAVNDAVKAAVQSNIPIAVAGGNDNNDACKISPATEPAGYTVGSSDIKDMKGATSNYGSCIDIFAPGVNITSLAPNGGLGVKNGTSMATPLVAGVFAKLLSTREYSKVQDLYDEVTNLSTKDVLRGLSKDTVNRLLYI